MENKNLISYSTFLQDMLNFQKAGTRGGSDFNYTDTPSHSYFKLLFYFHNNDTNETAGGLLAPTWQVATGNYYMYNSAWAYLMQNQFLYLIRMKKKSLYRISGHRNFML